MLFLLHFICKSMALPKGQIVASKAYLLSFCQCRAFCELPIRRISNWIVAIALVFPNWRYYCLRVIYKMISFIHIFHILLPKQHLPKKGRCTKIQYNAIWELRKYTILRKRILAIRAFTILLFQILLIIFSFVWARFTS